jgi:hypothetical protein
MTAQRRPAAEFGVPVAADIPLFRDDDIAVTVTSLRAFSTGFTYTLHLLTREPQEVGAFERLRHGHGDELLRHSVRYPDGATADNVTPAAGPLTLVTGSGGGGGHRYELNFWVSPLPQPGEVTFACRWPARNIPESAATIDGGLIAAAAARSTPVWPPSEAT